MKWEKMREKHDSKAWKAVPVGVLATRLCEAKGFGDPGAVWPENLISRAIYRTIGSVLQPSEAFGTRRAFSSSVASDRGGRRAAAAKFEVRARAAGPPKRR
jgi:hypothetical protein